jgi:hypothetical protein
MAELSYRLYSFSDMMLDTYPQAGSGWLGKFGQRDKWSFCLTAARMAAEQEKR